MLEAFAAGPGKGCFCSLRQNAMQHLCDLWSLKNISPGAGARCSRESQLPLAQQMCKRFTGGVSKVLSAFKRLAQEYEPSKLKKVVAGRALK